MASVIGVLNTIATVTPTTLTTPTTATSISTGTTATTPRTARPTTDDLFTIFYKPPQPIPQSHARATVSKVYSRHQHPDPTVQQSILQVWHDRKANNPKLFNGTKYRLHSVETMQDGHLHLYMSVTDYATYLGTNWNTALQEDGVLERCHLSDTFGVGGIVVTQDQYVVFIKRSEHVAEYANYLDIPGGHPEPSKVAGCEGPAWAYQAQEENETSIKSRDVVEEIFQSVVEEIYEEVNIPRDALRNLLLLFIMRQSANNGKPSAAFSIDCDLTSADVKRCYDQGPEDAYESSSLVMVQVAELLNMDVQDMRKSMTPAAIGSIVVWRENMAAVATATAPVTATPTPTPTATKVSAPRQMDGY